MYRYISKTISTAVICCSLLVFTTGISWSEEKIEPMTKTTIKGITFITGGVGLEERTELKKAFKEDYNCRIEIAAKGGKYLNSANVKIQDASGTDILTVDTLGPWLLVQLKDGSYTATIKHKDKTQTLKIEIASGKKYVSTVKF